MPSWTGPLMEPHSEYWLIAAEHGSIGLLVFISFMGILMYYFRQLTQLKYSMYGFLLAFLVGCYSDGFLTYAGPGFALVLFVAMGLGELLSQANLAMAE